MDVTARKLRVEVTRLDSSYFWVYPAEYTTLTPTRFKHLVFAWHAGSFYGTNLEAGDRGGVLLSPSMALDYFSSPSHLQCLQIVWGEEAQEVLHAAKEIKEAIVSGSFAPNYDAWATGQMGWKLLDDSLPGWWNRWLTHVIRQLSEENPTVHAAWMRLENEYPLLMDSQHRFAGMPGLPDGDEWLDAIGWQIDESPFYVGLRLEEPTQEGRLANWHLQPILQDKKEAEIMIPVVAGFEDRVPQEWIPFLAKVDRQIQKWAQWSPTLLERVGEQEIPQLKQSLTENEAWRFLTETSGQLLERGTRVYLPVWWEKIARQRSMLKAKVKSSVGQANQSVVGLEQIVQFDWKVAVGDVELSEEEFQTIVEQNRRLVEVRGQWIQMDPKFLQQARETMGRIGKKKGLTLRDVLRMYLGNEDGETPSQRQQQEMSTEVDILPIQVELNAQLTQMLTDLQQVHSIPQAAQPAGLKGELRTYQREGMSWLLFLRRFGLGGILADDMGLGKTVQWISYLLKVREEETTEQRSPSLLICPASVLGNWKKEFERFAPTLKIHVHYGQTRARGEAFSTTVQDTDVVLTTYTLSHIDEEELSNVYWDAICLDEAQNIKNAHTKQSSAARRLDGRHKVAMSGTPIENRLTELWSIFDFVTPGYLGNLASFRQQFVLPIEKEGDSELIGQLQRWVRPFLLRRVKNDPAIQLDLPEREESNVYVALSREQAALYETVIQEMFSKLDTLTAMERRGVILGTLTKLKQICDHPGVFLKEATGLSTHRLERSQKLQRLLEMVEEVRAEGEKCLIFTQFVDMGHLLQSILQKELGEQTDFLYGGTAVPDREKMINRFQTEPRTGKQDHSVLILSLKAGGVGLNLTAANHVFHFDRWWNPAVENQATDRVYRIGQTRRVQVHKFVTLGTLEERINEMIEQKMSLTRKIIGEPGESWISEFSNDELRELLMLRKEWVEV